MTELENNLTQILSEKSTKIIPENIKKGVTIFNVTGTAETSAAGVKLFKTEEEMQADTTAQEGDLAVVYRSEVKNMTSTTETASIIFPETVTLPTAYTGNCNTRLRAVDSSVMFDGNCELSQASFRFDAWSESGMIRVKYTSTDGITYTRTRFQGDSVDLTNPVELPTTCKVEGEWNDNLGYFMQAGGMYFEGLYENKIDTNIIQFLNLSATSFSNIDLVNKNATATLNNNDKYSLKIDKSKLLSILKANDIYTGDCVLFVTSNNELMYTSSLISLYDTTGSLLGYCLNGSYSNASSEFYKINLDNGTVTQAYTKSASNHFYGSSSSDNYYYLSKDEIDCVTLPTYINSNTNTYSYDVQIVSTDSNNPLQIYIFQLNYDYQGNAIKYFSAPTQLTATPEYVYEKEFYGQNGVEIGTLQNKENLTKDEVRHRVNIWSNYNSGIVCPSDASSMFYNRTSLTEIPLLDTSNVTNMSSMFDGCTNLTTIPLLNTSKLKDANYMFHDCTSLTEIPLLDISNVVDMSSMFSKCKKLTTIPEFNTSNVVDMLRAFQDCANLTTIPLLDTSKVTDMGATFASCKKLTTIPLLDTSSVTSMNNMFYYCTSLTTIPELNTINVTDMAGMLSRCTNLTTIPELNTINVTDMTNMFYYCTSLTTIPELNTSNVTNMSGMFYNCTSLTTIPELNTINVTDMSSMFEICTSLTTIPLLNTSNVTNITYMFKRCTSLSDESLNNVLAMCKNATSYTGTKTLAYIGLTEEQANRCKTLSNYSAFTAAGWTTGY